MDKFEIKEKIDGFIYTLYNFIVKLMFLFDYKSRSLIKHNVYYKDKHSGSRCFILGTGPSLNELNSAQLDKLKKEFVFGLNSLYKSNIGKSLNPNYYALVDNNYWGFMSDAYNDISKVYSENPPVFITDARAEFLINKLQGDIKAIFLYAKKYPVKKVSSDIDKDIYGLMNVVSVCIVTAIFMGFKEIYLLGCDYNAFCNFGSGHCYDDKDEMDNVSYNLSFYLKYYHITTEFHYLIAQLAKDRGVKIVNLSDVSLLDAYPRKPVSSVL